ncbi:GNAT family N-acetyltransferase [Dyella jejuensis]|uniref:GNAT family N-acetyltransferase n=1 Tax=Dyella jejuensis TaxID=1432009 RepID=A0ABW8JIT2_9GAMM
MHAPLIVLTDTPQAGELAVIRQQLDRFNVAACGIDDQRPLALVVKDPATHEVLGGLSGRTSRGVLFIDMFFLPEALRKQGLGSTLLRQAEAEGRQRGCHTGVLHTNDFQAPGFYKKYGWREFGTIPCDPPGSCRIFLSKPLIAAD